MQITVGGIQNPGVRNIDKNTITIANNSVTDPLFLFHTF